MQIYARGWFIGNGETMGKERGSGGTRGIEKQKGWAEMSYAHGEKLRALAVLHNRKTQSQWMQTENETARRRARLT